MAKHPKAIEPPGKVKIRVIEFEVEGSDATMQESLKSITAALSRGMAGNSSLRTVRYDAPRQLMGAEGDIPVDEAGGIEEEEEDALAPAPIAAKRQATSRKVIPMKVLTDIRLDDVSPSLKDFASEKAPTNDLKKYLVIAHWYKNHKGISDLTPEHFFTAYRFLGWTTPKDPSQPIRDLRHGRRTQLSPGTVTGTSTINHVGEQIVLDMGKVA